MGQLLDLLAPCDNVVQPTPLVWFSHADEQAPNSSPMLFM